MKAFVPLFLILFCAHLYGADVKLLTPENNASKIIYEMIDFTWEEVTDPLGGTVTYDLYLSTASNPELFASNIYNGLITDHSSAFNLELNGQMQLEFFEFVDVLSPLQTYYWKVVAKLTDGTSISSAVQAFTTQRVNILPTAPAMLSPANNAQNVKHENLTFNWTKSTDADGDAVTYNLYLGTNSSNLQLTGANLSTNSYTLPYNADDQKTYYWRVEAVDNYNGALVDHLDYPANNNYKFTVENYIDDAPSAVTLVSPVNGSKNTGTSVTFDWTDATDRDGNAITYEIYADTETNPKKLIGTSKTSTFTFQIPKAYTTYYWKVLATDGTNITSSVATFSLTPYEKPVAPSLLLNNGTENVTKRPILKWTAATPNPSEIILYDVYVDKKANPTNIAASNLRSTIFSPALEDANATYYWKVVAKTSWGDNLESPVHSFIPWKNKSSLTIDMVNVEGGSFKMGDTEYSRILPGFETWGQLPLRNTTPQHTVFLDGFSVGKYEITNSQFLKFLEATSGTWHIDIANSKLIYDVPVIGKWTNNIPEAAEKVSLCLVKADAAEFDFTKHSKLIWDGTKLSVKPGFEQYPAENISYYGALLFADWANLRLPTEAEWEYAALGGVNSNNYLYSGSNNGDECGWYLWSAVNMDNPMTGNNNGVPDRNNKGTHPGGKKKANELGIFDMSGNVAEYCFDYSDDLYYHDADTYNPLGPLTPGVHVVRGGKFDTNLVDIFSKARDDEYSSINNWGNGIRTAGNHSLDKTMLAHGVVLNQNGEPMEGITLTCGKTKAVTNKHGRFQFRLNKGEAVDITPVNPDYTFSPSNIKADNISGFTTNLNFTAYPDQDFEISGMVTNGNLGVANVAIYGLPDVVYTNSEGKYTARVPEKRNYTLTAEALGYDISPATLEVKDVQKDVANINFTATYTGVAYITGYVISEAGFPQYGILMKGFPGVKVYTSSTGFYNVPVTKGWTGQISPIEPRPNDYATITPKTLAVTNIQDNITQDFVYTPLFQRTFTGKVIDNKGKPIEGVEITGFDKENVLTNPSGIYGTQAGKNWTGTIAPHFKNYTFSPANLEILIGDESVQTASTVFVGTPPGDYLVSGIVKDVTGNPMQGVTLKGFNQNVITNINGEYAVWLKSDFSGIIEPEIPGYVFSPASSEISGLKADAVRNFTATSQENSYTVSGKITDTDNRPLSKVNLTGFDETVSTNDNGEFAIVLKEGWTGTFSPQLEGYTFLPADKIISSLNTNTIQNFTGTLNSYTISGKITTLDGAPIANTELKGFSTTVTTNEKGEYSTREHWGWKGTIAPILEGYSFTPENKEINSLTENTSIDFTGSLKSYTISGKIYVSSDSPLPNAEIKGFSNAVKTNDAGEYSTTEKFGWSGTINPNVAGYSFSPSKAQINSLKENTTINFEANLSSITILGKVINTDGKPLANVEIKGFSSPILTDEAGIFYTTEKFNWSGTIVPYKDGYSFSPAEKAIVNLQSSTVLNFTFSLTKYRVSGKITDSNNNPIANAELKGFSTTVRTNAAGEFFANEVQGWNGTISPALSGFSFEPPSQNISNLTKDAELKFTGLIITSVDAGTEITRCKIYPNPSPSGEFTIEIQEKEATVQIYNMLGKKIYSETISNYQKIYLQEGVYIIRIETERNIYVQKIVVE